LDVGSHLYGLGPYSKSDSPEIVDITK
jgi:hypothetical protein